MSGRLALAAVAAWVVAAGCADDRGPRAAPVPEAELRWFSRDGEPGDAVPDSRAAYRDLWFAHDEQSVIAATVEHGRERYWRIDVASGRRVRVAIDFPPAIRDRVRGLTSWSAEILAVEADGAAGDGDIVTFSAAAGAPPVTDLASPSDERRARLSADHRWMAYETRDNGVNEIYLRTFPNPNLGRWLLATGGATRPVWRRDSLEIFHWAPGGHLIVTPLKRGRDLILPGNARRLFTIADTSAPPFVATRDGRMLIATPRS